MIFARLWTRCPFKPGRCVRQFALKALKDVALLPLFPIRILVRRLKLSAPLILALASVDCGHGCLFDLDADPTEHVDLAAHKPTLVQHMRRLAAAYDETVYQSPGSAKADPAARVAANSKYGGFWGPWQSDEEFMRMEVAPSGPRWEIDDCGDCF